MPLRLRIDRDLSVPVTAQLRGQLEYGIAFGDIPPGSQLPSVRELADQLGIAPVTVSQVYRELQGKELLETRVGRGTFVRHDAPRPARPDRQSHALDDLVHRLRRTAREIGLSPGELAEIIAVRLGRLEHGMHLRILFVGNFQAATRRYVHAIQGYLRPSDRLDSTVLPDLHASPSALERARSYDIAFTLAYRAGDLRTLLGPAFPIMSIPFLPSAATRRQLADLSPSQRIGLVSTYGDYLVTFQRIVETYAPHIDVYGAAVHGDDDVDELLGSCDIAIYGTGSETVLTRLPPTTQAFEFQFEPDKRALIRDVLPNIEELRASYREIAVDTPMVSLGERKEPKRQSTEPNTILEDWKGPT